MHRAQLELLKYLVGLGATAEDLVAGQDEALPEQGFRAMPEEGQSRRLSKGRSRLNVGPVQLCQARRRTASSQGGNMSEQNKAAARRFFELWESGNTDQFDEVVAADAVDHDPQRPFPDDRGAEAARKTAEMFLAAFPDTAYTIEQQVAEGDLVVTRWIARGTHEGELMGIPATQKSVEVSGIAIDRFSDGKIVESWGNWDTIGLMQQLGAIPAPAETA